MTTLPDAEIRQSVGFLLNGRDIPEPWWQTCRLLLKNGSANELRLFQEMWENYLLIWRYYGMHLSDGGKKFNKVLIISVLERFKALSNRRPQKQLSISNELDGVIPYCIIELSKEFI